MRAAAATCMLILVALAFAGCSSDRIEKTKGDIFLSVTDFDGLPVRVSVNSSGDILQLGTIVITSFAKDPNATTSDLQSVEMDSYEVRFSRADAGSRLPPPLVEKQFGFIPAEGNLTITNLRLLGIEQFDNAPLSDLFNENGAFDKETGAQLVALNLTIRFFGRTISGDDVATEPVSFTIEFVP